MNAETRCVFVTGLPCAGKSEYGMLARRLGYAVAEWSSFLRADLTGRSAERSDYHSSVGEMVALKGIEHYPRKIFQSLVTTRVTQHVVVGARNPGELAFFRSFYAVSTVVWVSATYRQRFQRNKARQRKDVERTIERFLAADFHEMANGLAEIAATQVNEILFNDGGRKEFHEQVTRHLCAFLGDFNDSGRPL